MDYPEINTEEFPWAVKEMRRISLEVDAWYKQSETQPWLTVAQLAGVVFTLAIGYMLTQGLVAIPVLVAALYLGMYTYLKSMIQDMTDSKTFIFRNVDGNSVGRVSAENIRLDNRVRCAKGLYLFAGNWNTYRETIATFVQRIGDEIDSGASSQTGDMARKMYGNRPDWVQGIATALDKNVLKNGVSSIGSGQDQDFLIAGMKLEAESLHIVKDFRLRHRITDTTDDSDDDSDDEGPFHSLDRY